MAFNSREYEWADITAILGGRDLTGIRAVKYKESAEKEAVYAKGRRPHSIQVGNFAYEGEIGLLQSELEALTKSGNGSVLSLSLDLEVSYYANGVLKTDRIEGLQFTDVERASTQGDKFMDVILPFIALNIVQNA